MAITSTLSAQTINNAGFESNTLEVGKEYKIELAGINQSTNHGIKTLESWKWSGDVTMNQVTIPRVKRPNHAARIGGAEVDFNNLIGQAVAFKETGKYTISFSSYTIAEGEAVASVFAAADFDQSSVFASKLFKESSVDSSATAQSFDFEITEEILKKTRGQVIIGFANDGGKASRTDMMVDNVRISQVPEPSSTALIGLGGLALILRRRK